MFWTGCGIVAGFASRKGLTIDADADRAGVAADEPVKDHPKMTIEPLHVAQNGGRIRPVVEPAEIHLAPHHECSSMLRPKLRRRAFRQMRLPLQQMPAAIAFGDNIDVPGEGCAAAAGGLRGDGQLPALRQRSGLEAESETAEIGIRALDLRPLAAEPHGFDEPLFRHPRTVVKHGQDRVGILP